MRGTSTSTTAWRAAGLLWTIVVVSGFIALACYDSQPGAAAAVPMRWPTQTALELDGATLVVFAHPECPCTRATIGELGRLLNRTEPKPRTHVVFSGEGEMLRPSVAALLSSVTVLDDPHGQEAKRFGATTSGHTFLFGRDGELQFHGGITRSRGHHGDNTGVRAIADHIRTSSGLAKTPVYGCPLFGDGT